MFLCTEAFDRRDRMDPVLIHIKYRTDRRQLGEVGLGQVDEAILRTTLGRAT